MPRIRRSPYPLACTLDLFGDRWTLLVIRDLLLGKQRFDEFISSPEGIATNVLANRLKNFTEQGLVERLPHKEDKRRFFYQLTPRGKSTRQFLLPMIRWGFAQSASNPKVKCMAPELRLLHEI